MAKTGIPKADREKALRLLEQGLELSEKSAVKFKHAYALLGKPGELGGPLGPAGWFHDVAAGYSKLKPYAMQDFYHEEGER